MEPTVQRFVFASPTKETKDDACEAIEATIRDEKEPSAEWVKSADLQHAPAEVEI